MYVAKSFTLACCLRKLSNKATRRTRACLNLNWYNTRCMRSLLQTFFCFDALWRKLGGSLGARLFLRCCHSVNITRSNQT